MILNKECTTDFIACAQVVPVIVQGGMLCPVDPCRSQTLQRMN